MDFFRQQAEKWQFPEATKVATICPPTSSPRYPLEKKVGHRRVSEKGGRGKEKAAGEEGKASVAAA